MSYRHRVEMLDHEVHARWSVGEDGQLLYGQAITALMQDVLTFIRNPFHRMGVGVEDARTALSMALEATRRAKGATP